MLSKDTHWDPSSADPMDEKTPTSTYVPRFASSIQIRGERARVRATPGVPELVLGAPSGHPSAAEATIIIKSETSSEPWCDGVADTVGIARRKSNVLHLASIATFSGLVAIVLGILLAEFTRCRCSIWWTNDSLGSVNAPASPRLHRSNATPP